MDIDWRTEVTKLQQRQQYVAIKHSHKGPGRITREGGDGDTITGNWPNQGWSQRRCYLVDFSFGTSILYALNLVKNQMELKFAYPSKTIQPFSFPRTSMEGLQSKLMYLVAACFFWAKLRIWINGTNRARAHSAQCEWALNNFNAILITF